MTAWAVGALSWLVLGALWLSSREELDLLPRHLARRVHQGCAVVLAATCLCVPAAFTGGVTRYTAYVAQKTMTTWQEQIAPALTQVLTDAIAPKPTSAPTSTSTSTSGPTPARTRGAP